MGDYMLFRLDSRLVHGQVCTAWIPDKDIKRVVIVHDEYAQDEFLVQLHRSVVPAGVVCDTITTKDAVEQWKKDKFGDQRTIVIFQTPEHALAAYEAGIEFPDLQVATLAGDNQSVVIYKQVNVNSQNAKTILSLCNKGVEVYCQMFPSNPRVNFKELVSQKKFQKKLKL